MADQDALSSFQEASLPDEAVLDRLDAALDRIAQLGARRPDAAPSAAAVEPEPIGTEVAARLDALIGQVRALLAEPSA